MRISYWSLDVCSSDLTLWGNLMRSYNPSSVVPFGLIVPVVAMCVAALVLKERFTNIDLIASLITLLGLIINQLRFPLFKERTLFRTRSEERRLGKECVSTFRSGWCRINKKKKK